MSGSQPDYKDVSTRVSGIEVDRRKLSGGAAVLTTAGLAFAGRGVIARDASPEAEPQSESAATPETNAIGSDHFPVRSELGPAIPPEYTDAETNWPSQNRDLASTRQAVGSTISTANIGELGHAWSFPLDIDAAYGALVAAPSIVGDVIYQSRRAEQCVRQRYEYWRSRVVG